MGHTWPDVLTGLISGDHLSADTASWAMSEILAGNATDVQIAGFLVALRGIELHCMRIDDLAGELACCAELLVQSEASQQYGFRIEHGGTCLAEGRAAVMLQD